MRDYVLAFLHHKGSTRQVCLGCSGILHEQGMLNVAYETNGDGGFGAIVLYEIAPNFTLEECRKAVTARHIGPEWGA